MNEITIEMILDTNEVIERFHSKRNEVNLISNHSKKFVLKKFYEEEFLKMEVEILRGLQSLDIVPQLLEVKPPYILSEYIEGELYLERFTRNEEQGINSQTMISELLHGLSIFYGATLSANGQYIRNDINFRNFIYDNSKVKMLDFEQCKLGEIEEDIGKIMAFALMYDPIRTPWKQKFIGEFKKESILLFNLDETAIVNHFETELKNMETRRGLKR